jgi:hypothetical protein
VTDRRQSPDPNSPERNPLGLGARDRERSNTGSTADTSYDAVGSDVNPAREADRRFDDESRRESRPADPDVPSSDQP